MNQVGYCVSAYNVGLISLYLGCNVKTTILPNIYWYIRAAPIYNAIYISTQVQTRRLSVLPLI